MKTKNNEIIELDDEKIMNIILNDRVPKVNHSEIMKTCDIAAAYLPKQKNSVSFDKTFWKIVFLALKSKNLIFWLVCVFSLGSCTLLPKMIEIEGNFKLIYFITIAPMPFMLFCMSELYNNDKRLIEFEKTCHYNPKAIFVARLSICMLMNAIVILITGSVLNVFGVSLLKMYLYAFCLMFLMGSIATIIISYVDNVMPLSVLILAWIVIGMSFINNDEIMYVFFNFSTLPIVMALIVSIFLFICSSLQTTKKIYA